MLNTAQQWCSVLCARDVFVSPVAQATFLLQGVLHCCMLMLFGKQHSPPAQLQHSCSTA
jgi:hypothetical protein